MSTVWKHLPNVSSSFDDKIEEILDHLDLLELLLNRDACITYLDDKRSPREKRLSPSDTHSFKSAALLMIYNFVESICTAAMDDIHNHVRQASLKTNKAFGKKKLNPDFKKQIIKFLNKKGKLIEFIEKHNDRLLDKKILVLWVSLWLNEIESKTKDDVIYRKWFSGNVDVPEIKQSISLYGFKYKELDKRIKGKNVSSLQYIKDARNTLAHGSSGFRDFGQKISYSDIDNYFKDIKGLFITLFDYINDLLEQQAYFES